ncbi:hypothetical protein OAH18_02015 [bacterium]|nr:hypothetical protein [bacterium]
MSVKASNSAKQREIAEFDKSGGPNNYRAFFSASGRVPPEALLVA